jgi:hypothetical protein
MNFLSIAAWPEVQPSHATLIPTFSSFRLCVVQMPLSYNLAGFRSFKTLDELTPLKVIAATPL